jgi:cytochrome P450
VHHNEEFWRDPHTLDPERWSENFNPEPYSYMPFLAGPRGCLGKHFAMMTMKLTLVSILQKFDLTPRLDKERKPKIDQGMAVMRIRNNVDYELVPTV